MRTNLVVMYLDEDGSSAKVKLEFRWWDNGNRRVQYEVELNGSALHLHCVTKQQTDATAIGEPYKE